MTAQSTLTDAYVLERLLSPWQLHALCTDWNGPHGWRYQATHGYAGQGADGVWLTVSGDREGVAWRTEDMPGDMASDMVIPWGDVRQLLSRIPAKLIEQLAAALAAGWLARGKSTLGATTAAEYAAAAACWESLRDPVGQLDLLAELAGRP